jgi:site-specific DNA recombinase
MALVDTATNTTIALTYRRVSSYKQERDGVSLDVQNDQCVDYIRRQPGWRLGGDFSDTLTGRTAARKDYQRLLDEVRQLSAAGKAVVIVAAALDRMGRDLEESVRSRKELAGLDVPLHCIREGGVLSTTQANLLATIAQDESDRTSARVKGSRKRHREHGYRSTSRAPWGYVWGPSTEKERLGGAPARVLRLDPKTVDYVREAWARAAGGASVHKVAAWVAGLNSEARGGRALRYPNVLAMFKNVTYVARVADPKRPPVMPDLSALELPSGRWEPLIDDATWTAVHTRIAGHERVPRQASGEYLLSGLVRCPKCGLRMQGRRAAGAQRMPVRGYRCGLPMRGCLFGGRADLIERAALDVIEARLVPWTGDRAFVAKLRAAWERLSRPPSRPSQGRIRTLERMIQKARRRQDEMLSLLADKVVTREKYARGVDAEQADIDAAEGELAEMRQAEAPPVLPSFDEALAKVGGWARVLEGESIPEQRDVLAELVSSVVPRRVGHGKYTAEIVWTPLGDALGAMCEQAA